MHLQLLALHLRLQASAPSSQLCIKFARPSLPQFLYQLPPGAQQLSRPDFLNVPQFGHPVKTKALAGVMAEFAIGVLAGCHRANHR